MLHSSLVAFLNGAMSPQTLWKEIEAEVRECVAATAERGGVAPVILTAGPETQVTRRHVDVLLSAFVDAKLPLEAASYIADALILSDEFEWEDDAIAEAIFFLSDESAPLTLAEVKEAQGRFAMAG